MSNLCARFEKSFARAISAVVSSSSLWIRSVSSSHSLVADETLWRKVTQEESDKMVQAINEVVQKQDIALFDQLTRIDALSNFDPSAAMRGLDKLADQESRALSIACRRLMVSRYFPPYTNPLAGKRPKCEILKGTYSPVCKCSGPTRALKLAKYDPFKITALNPAS